MRFWMVGRRDGQPCCLRDNDFDWISVVMGLRSARELSGYSATVKEVLKDVGYDRAKYGFDCETCAVLSAIDGSPPTYGRKQAGNIGLRKG